MAKMRKTTATKRNGRPSTDDAQGFPRWEHGAFSFEGEIERLGAISKGMPNA